MEDKVFIGGGMGSFIKQWCWIPAILLVIGLFTTAMILACRYDNGQRGRREKNAYENGKLSAYDPSATNPYPPVHQTELYDKWNQGRWEEMRRIRGLATKE